MKAKTLRHRAIIGKQLIVLTTIGVARGSSDDLEILLLLERGGVD